MAKLTKQHRDLLAPHADKLYDLFGWIHTETDDGLASMLAACRATDQTNCGWTLYRVSRMFIPEIEAEIYRRSALHDGGENG